MIDVITLVAFAAAVFVIGLALPKIIGANSLIVSYVILVFSMIVSFALNDPALFLVGIALVFGNTLSTVFS